MILAGTLDHPADRPSASRNAPLVQFKVNTANFVAELTRAARQITRLGFAYEIAELAEHQVDALMYVRGGFDPEFGNDEAGRQRRDVYLRAIASHSEMGRVAAAAFLRGWATHRPGADAYVEPFAWHRYMAGTELKVSAA